jgi:hypothetical protein
LGRKRELVDGGRREREEWVIRGKYDQSALFTYINVITKPTMLTINVH